MRTLEGGTSRARQKNKHDSVFFWHKGPGEISTTIYLGRVVDDVCSRCERQGVINEDREERLAGD